MPLEKPHFSDVIEPGQSRQQMGLECCLHFEKCFQMARQQLGLQELGSQEA